MRIRATLEKEGERIVSEVAEVSKPGDLEKLVGRVFATARKKGVDLFNVNLKVEEDRGD